MASLWCTQRMIKTRLKIQFLQQELQKQGQENLTIVNNEQNVLIRVRCLKVEQLHPTSNQNTASFSACQLSQGCSSSFNSTEQLRRSAVVQGSTSLKIFNSIFNFIVQAQNSNESKLSLHYLRSSLLFIPLTYLIPTVKPRKQEAKKQKSLQNSKARIAES